MPTGYTAGVQDGTITDFRTFALRCARAFGATIMQREEPMDVPPAERTVEPYYRERVEKARQRITEVDDMTLVEAEAAALAEHARRVREWEASCQRQAEEQARYNAMLARAVEWEPPTPDHQGLKTFMVEQLRESKKFDAFDRERPVRAEGEAWLAKQRASAAGELRRAEESLREEEERCAKASDWVRRLYDSLTPTAATR